MGTLTLEQRYLEAVRRLGKRTEDLEEMALWKADLASRLWRAERALEFGVALYDIDELGNEAKLYADVVEAFKKKADR